jgi:hypothetical protein
MVHLALTESVPAKARVTIILDPADRDLFAAVARRDRATISATIRRLAVRALGEAGPPTRAVAES